MIVWATTSIHAAVDDRSRVAYAEILPDERKETASAFMTRAVGFFADRGITVERVLTDNGAARPYESNDSRAQELERWLHAYNYHRPTWHTPGGHRSRS